jgi:hypothetical protein
MNKASSELKRRQQRLAFVIAAILIASIFMVQSAFVGVATNGIFKSATADIAYTDDQRLSTNEAQVDASMLAKVSIPFIENQGQVSSDDVRFYANTFAGTVFVTEEDLTYALLKTDSRDSSTIGVAIKERFLSQQDLSPVALDKSDSVVNYFVGEKESWHSNIPTYDAITLGEVWPSIGVELRAYGKNVEKVFNVEPGANVNDIRLAFEGVRSVKVSNDGKLILETDIGNVAMTKPIAYQDIDGVRMIVDVSYFVDDDGYGFVVGYYNPSYTLVIDPLLASTFIGGSGGDDAFGIALDVGNVFVTGRTFSADYPTSAGAYDTSYNGFTDVFVTRLNTDLTATNFASTFVGGSSDDFALGIALDGLGNVFVTGGTSSADYPTSAGAYDTTHNGARDVFVTRLNTDLTATNFASTFVGGGSSDEFALGIALDVGNVFVTGRTFSADYPTSAGAYDTSFNGVNDVFVTRLNTDLTATNFASTFIGGSGGEFASGIALDGLGNVFVTGGTFSADYPTSAGAYDTSFNGGPDVFVTRLNTDLTATDFTSTFVGGSSSDLSNAIALDGLGNVFVTGSTGSSNYPTSAGAYDTTHNAFNDVFVTRLNTDLTATNFASTFVGGGSSEEFASGIALDVGNVFVTGRTFSADYPTSAGAYDTSYNGFADVFVTRLNTDLTATNFASTFVGGSSHDLSNAIALDGLGNVFVTGGTFSADYPTSAGAYDTSFNGGPDVFVTKITSDLAGVPTSPSEDIQNLINEIGDMGLPENVENSLTAPLHQSTNLLNDDNPNNDVAVCNKLDAFINEVNAKEGSGQLTPTQANDLRQAANDIKAEIGCP